jgi:hypothetical protein
MDEKTEAPGDRLNCRPEGSTGQQEIKMNPIQRKKTKRIASIAGLVLVLAGAPGAQRAPATARAAHTVP